MILRHDPGQAGIVLDEAGWTSVDYLLVAINLSMETLEEIVAADEKNRFEFNPGRTKIRASQGHSVSIDLGYDVMSPPLYLYHGTSLDNLESIMRYGLLKMERHDVHMFEDYKLALEIATKRRKNPVVLRIASGEMFEDGYIFKKSTNDVWLTLFVDKKYISEQKEDEVSRIARNIFTLFNDHINGEIKLNRIPETAAKEWLRFQSLFGYNKYYIKLSHDKWLWGIRDEEAVMASQEDAWEIESKAKAILVLNRIGGTARWPFAEIVPIGNNSIW
jgi:putative RNA 2'-phosphotransferase